MFGRAEDQEAPAFMPRLSGNCSGFVFWLSVCLYPYIFSSLSLKLFLG